MGRGEPRYYKPNRLEANLAPGRQRDYPQPTGAIRAGALARLDDAGLDEGQRPCIAVDAGKGTQRQGQHGLGVPEIEA